MIQSQALYRLRCMLATCVLTSCVTLVCGCAAREQLDPACDDKLVESWTTGETALDIAVCVNRDRFWVVTTHAKAPPQIWDARTGTLVREMSEVAHTSELVVLQQRGWAVCAENENDRVQIVSLADGIVVHSLPLPETTFGLWASIDESTLLIGQNAKVIVWNLDTWKQHTVLLPDPDNPARRGPVMDFAGQFGDAVVVWGGWDRRMYLLDFKSPAVLKKWDVLLSDSAADVMSAVVIPGSNAVFCHYANSDDRDNWTNELSLWDVRTERKIACVARRHHDGVAQAVGRLGAIVMSRENNLPGLLVWSGKDGEACRLAETGARFFALSYHELSESVFCGTMDGRILVRNISNIADHAK